MEMDAAALAAIRADSFYPTYVESVEQGHSAIVIAALYQTLTPNVSLDEAQERVARFSQVYQIDHGQAPIPGFPTGDEPASTAAEVTDAASPPADTAPDLAWYEDIANEAAAREALEDRESGAGTTRPAEPPGASENDLVEEEPERRDPKILEANVKLRNIPGLDQITDDVDLSAHLDGNGTERTDPDANRSPSGANPPAGAEGDPVANLGEGGNNPVAPQDPENKTRPKTGPESKPKTPPEDREPNGGKKPAPEPPIQIRGTDVIAGAALGVGLGFKHVGSMLRRALPHRAPKLVNQARPVVEQAASATAPGHGGGGMETPTAKAPGGDAEKPPVDPPKAAAPEPKQDQAGGGKSAILEAMNTLKSAEMVLGDISTNAPSDEKREKAQAVADGLNTHNDVFEAAGSELQTDNGRRFAMTLLEEAEKVRKALEEQGVLAPGALSSFTAFLRKLLAKLGLKQHGSGAAATEAAADMTAQPSL